MFQFVIEFLLLGTPLAALAFFIISLCLFISARKKNKLTPGSVDIHTLSVYKTLLIVSSVILVLFILIIIALTVIMAMSIAYM